MQVDTRKWRLVGHRAQNRRSTFFSSFTQYEGRKKRRKEGRKEGRKGRREEGMKEIIQFIYKYYI